ncbi:efflux RND transporter permease subunit (plasmid) [Azospirillum oryzae]|uniref:Efflux RND transporter permease subunit n=1 Tax=Azospirillum oryzae TaxID=286727 RepID=A0A6N1ASG6_9PROT|nr:efflux RND transporter permease subunit [Azospirillum oryzae]KAA0586864.1 efflux RND transporter permease subunit [Azospirillum oryzae]QKS54273.1 efflux RND transporter permease subunit [Azospirillum oryzae]GLR81899.1 acriflavin resistance protein [Azospirillum oryzae]
MVLSDISVRRPVLATVMSLALMLIGIVSYQRLSVREYPKIDEPVVTVETTYKGASAQIIESQVTQTLEDSLAGIEGIDVMSSISRAEKSQITLRFRLDRNVDVAASDVRDRVGRVRAALPSEIDEPVIAKVEADAQPIIYLAFSSDRHSPLEVTDFADRYVKDRLQNLPGVAQVRIFGERRFAMRLWLDPQRMAAYRVTPQDVENALRKQNVEIPAGRVESVAREFTVVSETDLRTPAEFENIILRDDSGYLVRLRDIGRAELGALDERVSARFNGRGAVAIGVVKQSTANPLDVSKAVNEALPKIRAAVPEGMGVDVGYDSSVFIAKSIDAVFHTIFEAIILVVLVIFFFLRSLRATLVPLVTIPVSLIGGFALMYAFGFSINTLTLLSMVLAIGLVVDDAIVMLENIFRYVEEGMNPFQAALKGSREIGFAVIAMTITLAAVYAPIGFMTGRTGRLFTEFALTLAGAVIVSGFVALTLSPMMCSKLLKHETKHGLLYRAIERLLEGMTNGYRRLLRLSLRVRPLVLLIGLGVAAASYVLFTGLKSELAPVEDRGTIVGIAIAPEGSTLDYTMGYAQRMEALFRQIPVLEKFFVVVGFPVVNQGIAFVRLIDWDERDVKQQAITAQLFPKMFGIPGILGFVTNPPSLGQSPIDKPVNFVIQTSLPFEELQTMVNAMMAEARNFPGLTNLDTDLKLNKPELRVSLDRDKSADLGVDVDTVGRTLETLLGGRQVTRFKKDGKQYDVIVQVANVDRRNPDDIAGIYVRGGTSATGGAGQMISLANLVKVEERVAPKELNHFNKLRSATITATLAPGTSLGEALAVMQAAANKVLPATAQTDYAGQSREFRESATGLYFVFILALAFIYLVLAAQFESFIDPFVIMLTVPLSMTGALAALQFSGGTMNVYSQIGLVTLVGLITKHGILIVEFANQLQRAGTDIRKAVEEAAVLRLRPILMTTGAMVLGAVPLAYAKGAGAESRQAIGAVIVGGMTLGTLLTLFVVPTVYSYLARKKPMQDEAAEQGADGGSAHGVPHPAE